jgi:hypothetical protein
MEAVTVALNILEGMSQATAALQHRDAWHCASVSSKSYKLYWFKSVSCLSNVNEF